MTEEKKYLPAGKDGEKDLNFVEYDEEMKWGEQYREFLEANMS